MKLFLSLIIVAFTLTCLALNQPTAFNIDPVASGSISSSGSIQITNVQRAFNIGYQINSVVSGTVGTPTAVLQGSNDCVTYFALPIKATGDATKTATLTTSGSFFLGETNLDVNCTRVFYSGVAGGGSLNVQEIRKVHGSNF